MRAKVTSLMSEWVYYVCFITQLIPLKSHAYNRMCMCIVNNRKYFVHFEKNGQYPVNKDIIYKEMLYNKSSFSSAGRENKHVKTGLKIYFE